MLNIKDILGSEYMSRFKVFHPQTLFEPTWENLKENRCPLCSNKLKFPLKGGMVMCRSNKHGKPFIIKKETLNKLR